MLRFARRFVVSFALAAAAIAPALPTHAATQVHDDQNRPCRLTVGPPRSPKAQPGPNAYVCGGVTYSVSDPRLVREPQAKDRATAPTKPVALRALPRSSAPHDVFVRNEVVRPS